MTPIEQASSGFSRRDILKMFGAAAAGTAVTTALAACTPSGSSAAKTLTTAPSSAAPKGTATLWFRNDDLLKVFKTVVPSFNAKYPQVHLDLVGVDLDTKLAPALISGTGVPDGSFY